MAYSLTKEDIDKISMTLGEEPKSYENSWAYAMHNKENKQSLVFTIYNDAILDGDEHKGTLISVQTQHGYFELHDCTAYIVFKPDENIFLQTKDQKLSCIVIGKECTCSLFCNIDKKILNADFTTLDPAVLLAAMQLSITEDVSV